MTTPTCSHQWRPVGGCLQCPRPHAVAPYIEAGNHRALEPGRVYRCRCGAALHIPDEAEACDETETIGAKRSPDECPYCGEEDCEASCTGAILARAEKDMP